MSCKIILLEKFNKKGMKGMNRYMELAKRNAEEGINRGEGGPFGAVI